jgi:hypothetical protein
MESTIAEYQALLNGLRRTQGFGLFFVECELGAGDAIGHRLADDLAKHTVIEVNLAEDGNLLGALKDAVLIHAKVDVALVQGLDPLLTKVDQPRIPPGLVHLNQQREAFRDRFQIRLVLFGSSTAMTQLMRQAPDFFDWRSGLFRF